ncbi:MAG: hypothetical protein GY754_20440 [bacterium]|nr:hypothetical protein [bacterium]
MTFDELSKLGTEADAFSRDGNYAKAIDTYFRITDNMVEDKNIYPYIAGKTVLGLLYTFINRDEIEKAFQLWSSHRETTIFGMGISALEEGLAAPHDTMLYFFICAYLVALTGMKPEVSAGVISLYMHIICSYALDEDEDMIAPAFTVWKLSLLNIFNESNAIPARYFNEIKELEKNMDTAVLTMESVKLLESMDSPEFDLPVPGVWDFTLRSDEKMGIVMEDFIFALTELLGE